MKSGSLIVCIMLLATAAAAQAPDGVHVMMPNGMSYNESTATSGTLSGGGSTCTWHTQDGYAWFTFTGSYTTSWIHPQFDFFWFNTGVLMPLAVQVTSVSGGTYGFDLPFNTGAWNHAVNESGLTGNWDYGNTIPPSSRIDCNGELSSQLTPWDITYTFFWGEGVATEPSSWGAVKALFR